VGVVGYLAVAGVHLDLRTGRGRGEYLLACSRQVHQEGCDRCRGHHRPVEDRFG
jgi:hypothetical protein